MNGGGNPVRRHAQERREYQRDLERLVEFVNNNPGGPRRPDITGWMEQRRKTIPTLDELRRKLDKVCVCCNYGKGVGDTAEIAGSAASIVGALMGLGGCSSADTVMNVGNLLQHSGALVEGASNVTESLLSNKYLNEVQAVLERDQEFSRPIMNLLVTSANLDEILRELFGCDLESAKLSNVLKTFHEFSRLHTHGKGFQTTLELMERGRYSVYLGTDVQLEYLQKFFAEMEGNPVLADAIRTALSVLSGPVCNLQVASDAVAVCKDLLGEEESIKPQSLRGGLNPDIPTAGAVSTFCLFQTINIATNMVSLRNVVKIIQEGKSKYSDALKLLSSLLALELMRIEAL